MNDHSQTPAEAPAPDIHPAPEARLSALAQAWRTLSHPALLTFLLALAAGALAVHLWLPQLPTSLAADPAAGSAWLDEMAAQTPGGNVLRALGAFDLAHNGTLRVVLALLAAALLIHLTNGTLRALAARRLTAPLAWLPGMLAWEATLPARLNDETWERTCSDACSQARMQAEEQESGETKRLCDCHARWQWPALLTEIGLLLALLALLLNLFSGWQMDNLTLDPGETISLAPYADLTVGLSGDASQIILCCPERRAPLARGSMMRGGVQVRVTDEAQALHISLERNGEALNLQAIEQGAQAAPRLIVHFPQVRSERAIAAPEANLFFRLAALDDGGFRVQALDANNQVILSKKIQQEAALPVGEGLTLHLTPATYITIRAQGRPWTWLLWPALALTLVGLFAHWRYPYWRVGALQNQAGVALRWQGPKATRRRFAAFIAHLQSRDQETT